jgi:C4-dicarboxylate-specific signal transduction histidine kinase
VHPGPNIVFEADPDQLEQMFINLVRNAADAVLENSSDVAQSGSDRVLVRWDASDAEVTFFVDDVGPGLLNPANVFTPFYTTKPHGSGVGLVLSRQIAEAHGGRIEIGNRANGPGCTVKVVLPRSLQR